MIFFSQLLNREVVDIKGHRVGSVSDLVVSNGEIFPRVAALIVFLPRAKGLPIAGSTAMIPWSQVINIEEKPIYLNVSRDEVETYNPSNGDLLLGRDILDKQIVDTQGRRIVKVNDLKLAQIKGVARLVGADISLRAFLRRLGAEGLGKVLPVHLPERLITWNYIEPLDAALANVKLSIPQSKIADLHPADIADLIEQMEPAEGSAVLQGLPDATAADTLSELQPNLQSSLIQSLGTERASDLLEIMPPDEAADILGDLSEEKAEELLSHMAPVEAQDVRELLRYDEHSAGGIMTTDVLRLHKQLTVEEAIERLRQAAPDPEVAYYLYVVDAEDHLAGVVSLRDLVISQPGTKIEEIMDGEVIKVQVDADQEDVARQIAKYDLLAIPVVDAQNHLQGIVTVDDVVDVIQEEAEEDISQVAGLTVGEGEARGSTLGEAIERFGWLSLWLAGGLAIGLIVRVFSQSIQSALSLIYFIPLLLLVAGGAVGQSIAAVGHALSLGRRQHVLWREMQIASLTGLVSGACVALLVFLWARNVSFALIVGASLSLSVWVAAMAGAFLPFVADKTQINRMILSSSALAPLVAVFSILVYLGLATYLMDRII